MATAIDLLHRLNGLLRRLGFQRDWFLIPLAAVIGVLAGALATGFSWLVEEAGHFFYGYYGQELFPFSQYVLLIALPSLGGIAVGLIQQYLSRTGPTHGIPEVMEALARRNGRMPIRMGLFKTITASITIGSGGSAGVEGPIIQTGSVFGSVVGQRLGVDREHMHTLVGCGAAAGLAGIFNAPIASVMFVLEVMLRDFSVKTFIPVVVASVFGVAMAQALLGENVAVFNVPQALHTYNLGIVEVGPYAILGVVCGLVGVAFALSEEWSEKIWHAARGPQWLRPGLGGIALGVLGLIFVLTYGNPVPTFQPPAFFSNGYPVTEALLDPVSYAHTSEKARTAAEESAKKAQQQQAQKQAAEQRARQALETDTKQDQPSTRGEKTRQPETEDQPQSNAGQKQTTNPPASKTATPPANAPTNSSANPTIESSVENHDSPGPKKQADANNAPATHVAAAESKSNTQAPTEEPATQSPAMSATIPLLLGLLVFKVLGTVITMGSGGSGGFIEPSLFIGATLGGVFAMILQQVGLFPGFNPATYALAGMAGMFAATIHCPLTAFLLVIEVTQDYRIILPVMLVAILATTVSQFINRDSIYTAWLRRQGVRVGSFADMVMLRRLTVADVPLTPAVIVHPEEPAQRLLELAEDFAVVDYVVCDEAECYQGMVVGEDVRTTLLQREAIPLMIVGELMRDDLPTVTRDETLDAVLDKFSQHEVSSLVVVDNNGQASGMITRARLMQRYHRMLEE